MSKKILYLDMDNVLVDFASAIPRLTRREREQYEGRLDDVPAIFARMDPVDGAVEAFCGPGSSILTSSRPRPGRTRRRRRTSWRG